jgi:hypothetical protein
MEMKISEFEVKHFDGQSWEEVSERIVMQRLQETYSLVTPAISQMIQGKYAHTPHGIFRMKKESV